MARQKQATLPGVEKPTHVAEIEQAAQAWDAKVDERMVLTTQEVALKKELIRVMRRHKVSTYRIDTGTTFQITEGEVTVKRIKDSDKKSKSEKKKDDASE